MQHYKKLKAQGMVIDRKGNELIEQMPEIPEELGMTGRQRWQVYCQYLIDEDRLYQSYLFGLMNLCYLEEQLQEVQEKLDDVGAVNIYENGIQRNGYASHFDKLLNHIRSLRSDYGLTPASQKSTGSAGGSEEENQSYGSKRSKGF
jgi:phage terminase small subunit